MTNFPFEGIILRLTIITFGVITKMKKKIFAAIVAVLLVCVPLIGCGEAYRNTPVEGVQDTSYVVMSNGGSAVQYGNYMYFINGYRGYTDDGKQNYWGNVDKGGLYRAELLGSDAEFEYVTSYGITETLKTFKSNFDPVTGYEFVTKKETVVTGYKKDNDGKIVYDDNDKPIELTETVDSPVVDRISSKTIGTSGYAQGGIFIYDDRVYYASPSNNQNRDGSFDVNKTMFFTTKLDGTDTKLLYTTKNDSTTSEYAFYNQRGKIILAVHDGTSIISVIVNNNKVEAVKESATNVSAVLFPVNEIYYKGIDTNGVEDFVYYTRAIDEEDQVRSGNIVVAMRPDGSESGEVLATGNTITLRSVESGYLFYEEARNGGNVIAYTNLHKSFVGGTYADKDGEVTIEPISPTYRDAYEAKKSEIEKTYGANSSYLKLLENQSGIALNIEDIGSYTGIVCFRPDRRSNEVYALCYSSSGMFLYDGVEMKKIYSNTVNNIYAIKDNTVYFGDGNGSYYATNAYRLADENEVLTLGSDMNTSATFKLDIVGEFAMMFGEVDDYANDYAFFVNIGRIDDKQFVGAKASDDIYDPSVELNTEEE